MESTHNVGLFDLSNIMCENWSASPGSLTTIYSYADFAQMKNRIAEIRKARGLTLREVAERASTTNQQVSHLERGGRKLSYEWMERLANALSCHPLELLENPPAPLSDQDPALPYRERKWLDLVRALSEDEQDSLWEAVQPMARFVRRNG